MNTILTALTDYEATWEELSTLGRIGAANRLDHRHRQYQALQQKLSQFVWPDRGQAEAACLQELQQFASESLQLLNEWRNALRGQMEARSLWAAAEVVADYANRYHALGIDAQAARRDARTAQAAFELASKKSKEIDAARSRIFQCVTEKYPDCDLRQPETFEAAARGRIERVLGEYYSQQQPAGQRWGRQ
jgi:hypothetical protein